ncbi:MAG: DUF1127 domain-containing protein [Rhodobacteraceae bacterium]|nr:DUF1127 domain-containing protein [Paracoccaceae bacterium]
MHPYLLYRNYITPLPYGARYHQQARLGDSILRRALQSMHRKWKRRKMIAALESMDDWLLRDIGIFRGDIHSIVDGFSDRELGMRIMAAPGKPRRDDQSRWHLVT